MESARLRLCVDGARRCDGSASGGMGLFAYLSDGSVVELLRGGVLLGNLSSAFLAESLALEWASNCFVIGMDSLSTYECSSGTQSLENY